MNCWTVPPPRWRCRSAAGLKSRRRAWTQSCWKNILFATSRRTGRIFQAAPLIHGSPSPVWEETVSSGTLFKRLHFLNLFSWNVSMRDLFPTPHQSGEMGFLFKYEEECSQKQADGHQCGTGKFSMQQQTRNQQKWMKNVIFPQVGPGCASWLQPHRKRCVSRILNI